MPRLLVTAFALAVPLATPVLAEQPPTAQSAPQPLLQPSGGPLNLLPPTVPHLAQPMPPPLDAAAPAGNSDPQAGEVEAPPPTVAEPATTPPEASRTPAAKVDLPLAPPPAPVVAAPLPPPPPVTAAPEPKPDPQPQPQPASLLSLPAILPEWMLALLVVAGALLAGLCGVVTAALMRRHETKNRRRAIASVLATELETRRQAFEAVPLPPNAEAGVSFVSAVTALAAIDGGLRAMHGVLHLLPDKLATHITVHYAAVNRVSDFVKGQSLTAGLRMLQANRIGGHPCPDAVTMREAHQELAAAFRGIDKLIQALRHQR